MKQTVEEASRTHWSESTYKEDAKLANDTITISRVGGSTGAVENIFLQQDESKIQRSISLEVERV